MTKFSAVLTILVVVLVFVPGCPPTDQGPAEPPVQHRPPAELRQTDSNTPEPPEPEPPIVEPNQADVNTPQPIVPEPNKVEPQIVDSNTADPNIVDANVPDPNSGDIHVADPNSAAPQSRDPNKIEQTFKAFVYDDYAKMLRDFVDDDGMVDYRKLKRKRRYLREMLAEFARFQRKEYNAWPKEDKIAFWINAYNIRMLKVIVDNYPIKGYRVFNLIWGPDSIRHINKSVGGIRNQKLIVMDEEFTLADIEGQIVSKQFDEPRALLALTRASLSGPLLHNEPYYGNELNKQLDKQSKRFASDPLAFAIDREKAVVYLSAILDPKWHGKAFLTKYGTEKKFKARPPETRAVLSFLTDYIPARDVSFLEVEPYTVEYMKYNWKLNDKAR